MEEWLQKLLEDLHRGEKDEVLMKKYRQLNNDVSTLKKIKAAGMLVQRHGYETNDALSSVLGEDFTKKYALKPVAKEIAKPAAPVVKPVVQETAAPAGQWAKNDPYTTMLAGKKTTDKGTATAVATPEKKAIGITTPDASGLVATDSAIPVPELENPYETKRPYSTDFLTEDEYKARADASNVPAKEFSKRLVAKTIWNGSQYITVPYDFDESSPEWSLGNLQKFQKTDFKQGDIRQTKKSPTGYEAWHFKDGKWQWDSIIRPATISGFNEEVAVKAVIPKVNKADADARIKAKTKNDPALKDYLDNSKSDRLNAKLATNDPLAKTLSEEINKAPTKARTGDGRFEVYQNAVVKNYKLEVDPFKAYPTVDPSEFHKFIKRSGDFTKLNALWKDATNLAAQYKVNKSQKTADEYYAKVEEMKKYKPLAQYFARTDVSSMLHLMALQEDGQKEMASALNYFPGYRERIVERENKKLEEEGGSEGAGKSFAKGTLNLIVNAIYGAAKMTPGLNLLGQVTGMDDAMDRYKDNYDQWSNATFQTGRTSDFLSFVNAALETSPQIIGIMLTRNPALGQALFMAAPAFGSSYSESMTQGLSKPAAYAKATADAAIEVLSEQIVNDHDLAKGFRPSKALSEMGATSFGTKEFNKQFRKEMAEYIASRPYRLAKDYAGQMTEEVVALEAGRLSSAVSNALTGSKFETGAIGEEEKNLAGSMFLISLGMRGIGRNWQGAKAQGYRSIILKNATEDYEGAQAIVENLRKSGNVEPKLLQKIQNDLTRLAVTKFKAGATQYQKIVLLDEMATLKELQEEKEHTEKEMQEPVDEKIRMQQEKINRIMASPKLAKQMFNDDTESVFDELDENGDEHGGIAGSAASRLTGRKAAHKFEQRIDAVNERDDLTPEQKEAEKDKIMQEHADWLANQHEEGQQVFTDFDDTVFANGKLTPLGEELKQRAADGEDITVLTARADTPENRKFIAQALGISEDKVKAGLDAKGKATHLTKGSTYYNENDAELAEGKNVQGVNVVDVKVQSVEKILTEKKAKKRQRELEEVPLDEKTKLKLDAYKEKDIDLYRKELEKAASETEQGSKVVNRHKAEDILSDENAPIEDRIMAKRYIKDDGRVFSEQERSYIKKAIEAIESGKELNEGQKEIKKWYDKEQEAKKPVVKEMKVAPVVEQKPVEKKEEKKEEKKPAPTQQQKPEGQEIAKPETFATKDATKLAAAVDKHEDYKIRRLLTHGAKILRTFRKLMPDLNVTFHWSEDSFVDAAVKSSANATTPEEIAAVRKNAKGAGGFFIDKENKQIHISIPGSLARKEGDEVFHEAAHPLFEMMVEGHPDEIDKKFDELESLQDIVPGVRKAIYFGHNGNYTGIQKKKESIVQFMAMVAKKEILLDDLDPSALDRVADFIKRFLNSIGFDFELATGINKKDSLVDAARKFTYAIDKGKTLRFHDNYKSKDGEKLTSNDISWSMHSEYTDENVNVRYERLKDSEEFKKLVDKKFITHDKMLKSFEDEFGVLHLPDMMFAGNAYWGNEKEAMIKGQGGVYFAMLHHNERIIWAANSQGSATRFANVMNDARRRDEKKYKLPKGTGTARIFLISSSPKKLLSSTAGANGLLDILLKKAFEDRLGITQEQVRESLYQAAQKFLVQFDEAEKAIAAERKEQGKPPKPPRSIELPNLKPNMSLETMVKQLKEFNSVDNAIFDDRGLMAENIADALKINVPDIETQKQIVAFMDRAANIKSMTTGGRLSKANFLNGIGSIMQEPLTKGISQNRIYSVITVQGEVRPIKLEGKHDSYQYGIEAVNEDARATIHNLQDRELWTDQVVDLSTGRKVSKKNETKVLGTTAGLSGAIRIVKNVENKSPEHINKDIQMSKGESRPVGKDVYPEIVNGFYSPLEKILLETKADKLPVKQWLERFGGSEEARMTRLTDWLKQQEGSISRSDIQKYMRENRIQIIVTEFSGTDPKSAKNRYGSVAKLELPGAKESYKEIVVTLPNRSRADELPEDLRGIYGTLRYSLETYGVGSAPYDSVERKFIEMAEDNGLTREDAKEYIVALLEDTPKLYQSLHYSDKNVLFHLRMNVRDGERDGRYIKILFLEELQSDWAQEAREKGFKLTRAEVEKRWTEADKKYGAFTQAMNKKYGDPYDYGDMTEDEQDVYTEVVTERARYGMMLSTKDEKKMIANQDAVNIAPFISDTAAWTKMGFKLALKEAVKQKYDQIAWTTGEQQIERYKLQKDVDVIRYERNGGSFLVHGIKDDRIIFKEVIPRDKLESKVGKDVAARIKNSEGESITMESDPNAKWKIFQAQQIGSRSMVGYYGSPTERAKKDKLTIKEDGKNFIVKDGIEELAKFNNIKGAQAYIDNYGLGILGGVAKSLTKQEPTTSEIDIGATYTVQEVPTTGGRDWVLRDSQGAVHARFNSRSDAMKAMRYATTSGKSMQHAIDITPEVTAEVRKGLPMFSKGGKPVMADVVNGFYSPLEKTINGAKQDKMPAKQWLEKFANTEEARLTGLTEWLNEQKGSVSKVDIQNFLKENRIEIIEKEKSLDKVQKLDWKEDVTDRGDKRWTLGDAVVIENVSPDGGDKRYPYYTKGQYAGETAWLDRSQENASGITAQGKPVYADKQLAGESENYKEILVMLPGTGQRAVDDYNAAIEKEKKWLGKNNIGGLDMPTKAQRDEHIVMQKELDRLKRELPDGVVFNYNTGAAERPSLYKSEHWIGADEGNVVVHLRMNTRTDADGKKVLFLEEIQSDWGQDGRRKGFTDPLEDKKYEAAKIFKYQIWDKKHKGEITAKEANEKVDALSKETGFSPFEIQNTAAKYGDFTMTPLSFQKIAPAPFVTKTTDWVKLAWKVALKEAAKQDVDKIAWATGEQQNERYQLTHKLDVLSYTKKKNGEYQLDGRKDNNVVFTKVVKEDDLEGLIGKELAQKIIAGEGEFDGNAQTYDDKTLRERKAFTGKDLVIGDRPMVGFYGSTEKNILGIVGNVGRSMMNQEPGISKIVADASKYYAPLLPADDGYYETKTVKDNVVVGEWDTLKEAQAHAEELSREKRVYSQHSFDVTPEKKAEVEKGQPMFSKGDMAKSEEYVLKSQAVLSQLYPKAKLLLYDNYAEYLVDGGVPSTYGVAHMSEDGEHEVMINLQGMRIDDNAKTPIHEVIHPIVFDRYGVNRNEMFMVWNGLLNAMRGAKGFDAVIDHAKLYDQKNVPTEGLTELLTQIVLGNIDISSVPAEQQNKILKLLNRLFELMGMKFRFDSPESFRTLAKGVKTAFDTLDVSQVQKSLKGKLVDRYIAEQQERLDLFASEKMPQFSKGTSKKRDAVLQAKLDAIRAVVKTELKGQNATNTQKVKAVKEKIRDDIRAMLKDAHERKVFSGDVKASVLESALKKLSNVESPYSMLQFMDYLDKLLDNVEYAKFVQDGNKIRKKIKTAAKSKVRDSDAVTRDILEAFARIKPDNTTDIDKYLEIANRVLSVAQGVKVSNTSTGVSVKNANYEISHDELTDYIKEQMQHADKKAAQRLADMHEDLVNNGLIDASVMTAAQIQDIINTIAGADEAAIAAAKEELERNREEKLKMLKSVAEYQIEALQRFMEDDTIDLTEKERETAERLLDIDIEKLNQIQLAKLIDVINNIVVNENFVGSGDIAIQSKMRSDADELRQKEKQMGVYGKMSEVAHWAINGLASQALWFEFLSKLTKAASEIQRLIGIEGVKNGNAKSRSLQKDAIKGYDDLKKGMKGINSALNRFRRGVYADVMNNFGGTQADQDAEFKRRKKWAKESIRRLLESEEDDEWREGKLLAHIYDELLEGSETQDDVRVKMEVIEPNNIRLVKYWQDKFANRYDLVKENAGIFNNRATEDVDNYTATMLKGVNNKGQTQNDVDILAQTFISRNLRLNPAGTKIAKVRSEKPKPNMALNYDFDYVQSKKYFETNYDIETAEHILQAKAFLESDEAAELLGGTRNVLLVAKNLQKTIALQRGQRLFEDDDTAAGVKKYTDWIHRKAVRLALYSVFQWGKQYFSILPNTIMNLGVENLDLLARSWVMNVNDPIFDDFNISQRGSTGAGFNKMVTPAEIEAAFLGTTTQEVIQKVLKLSAKVSGGLAELMVKGDVRIARRSWWAFYLKDLRSQGIDVSKLDIEQERQNPNKEAAAYAEQMVSRNQNPNDPSSMANFYRQSNSEWLDMIKRIGLPFSTFPMNMRMRMTNDVQKFVYGTWSAKGEAIKSLIATGVEQFVFNYIKVYVISLFTSFAADQLAQSMGWNAGDAGGDDTDKEEEEKKFKRWIGSSVSDLFFSGMGTGIQTGFQHMANVFQHTFIASKKKKLGKVERTPDWYYMPDKEFLDYMGVYGIAPKKFIELWKDGKYAFIKKTDKNLELTYDDDLNQKKIRLKEKESDVMMYLFILDALGLVGLSDAEVTQANNKLRRMVNQSMEKRAGKNWKTEVHFPPKVPVDVPQ